MNDDTEGALVATGIGTFALLVLGGVATLCLAGCPRYGVYQQRMAGEAELANAMYSKQVAVQSAQAKFDSAKLEAQTDIVRAGGIAQANKIVAQSLGGPEGYLRWKYIEMLQETAGKGQTVIYVPTEAGLPVLEAGRGAQLSLPTK